MNFFSEREKAFEGKYRIDQETEFKIKIIRDRLIGQWAAKKMGLTEEATNNYIQSIVDMECSAGAPDVPAKLLQDLTAQRIEITEHRIHREIDRITEVARQQMLEDVDKA